MVALYQVGQRIRTGLRVESITAQYMPEHSSCQAQSMNHIRQLELSLYALAYSTGQASVPVQMMTPAGVLCRARHSHGYHAERGSGHGRRAASHSCQRDLPAAADVRAPGRHRNHAPAAHSHPAEQDRPHQVPAAPAVHSCMTCSCCMQTSISGWKLACSLL